MELKIYFRDFLRRLRKQPYSKYKSFKDYLDWNYQLSLFRLQTHMIKAFNEKLLDIFKV